MNEEILLWILMALLASGLLAMGLITLFGLAKK